MNIRFAAALLMGKLSIPVLKITKHNGTDFPGTVALKICPDFIKYIDKPKKIVTITGTDGKTTCTNLACDIMSQTGQKILTNRAGSNINTGIATILLKGVNLLNKSQYDMAILEVDERSSKRIYPYLKPDYTVVTNLFRDSIMRNAHPQYIADFLTSSLPATTKLILNGDDLITASVSPKNERVYFGLNRLETDTQECVNLLNDYQICPVCHSVLKYEYRHYHHIGKAYCPECGFKSPEIDYLGTLKDGSLDVNGQNYQLISDSIFNVYNMIAVIALASQLGLDPATISKYMLNGKITATRFNQTDVNGCIITMQMAKDKNALACSRVFDYISQLPGEKELFLMMSCRTDEAHWSENPCWLYDCDFEFLNNKNITHIVSTGPRCKDFRLRLNLAGYPDDQIDTVRNESEAVNYLHFKPGTTIYMFYGADAGGVDFGFKMRNEIIAKAKEVTSK